MQTPSRFPKSDNLSQYERRALKELQQNKDITIKKADKGGAMVIMDTSEYIKEGLRQLKDTKYYLKKDTDLTSHHTECVRILVTDMHNSKEISDKTFDYLTRYTPRTPKFYM